MRISEIMTNGVRTVSASIVTVSDLLEVVGRGGDRPTDRGRPIVTHRVPHRKARRGSASW
jgi:hypothetical protein